jgi:LysW-gamma-L-lysine carboxypeptidase
LAAFLVEQMKARGFSAWIDEAGNARGMVGSGDRTLLLLGHMDTVPGFIPVREVEGKLFGRGSVDAKGPLCAFVAAAARLERSSLAGKRILVVGAVEEECPTSKGARFLFDQCKPDFILIGEPSGWEGITLGYKGRMELALTVTKDLTHRASASMTAAAEAVAGWSRLLDWQKEVNSSKRVFDQIDFSLLNMGGENDGFVERAWMEIDVRTPVSFEETRFSVFLDTIRSQGAEVQVKGEVQAIKASKNNPLVRAFVQAIRAHGSEPRFKLKTGTSDMNIVGARWRVPVVAYGPGNSRLDHTPHEHIHLEEYCRAISVLQTVLARL